MIKRAEELIAWVIIGALLLGICAAGGAYILSICWR